MELKQLKGTKEYLPEEQTIREKIIDILKKNFKLYGYKPIETSILEYYGVAANKYAGGDEILKETYKLTDQGGRELCLRYELTFKLAKFIGLNQNIRMPFKRYEIGKVFRDGPIKTGRLREFTQCDVDVVGIKSVAADAEFMLLVFDVFNELNLPVFVQVNDRGFLFGLFEFCGVDPKQYIDVALSLDKLEKFGENYVKKELLEKGIAEESTDKLFSLLKTANTKQTNEEKLDFFKENLELKDNFKENLIKENLKSKDNFKENLELKDNFKENLKSTKNNSSYELNQQAQKGIENLQNFFKYCADFGINKDVIFAPSLARGLGYYTGFMCEVYLKNSEIKSSVSAGGRWDKMIGNFLGRNIKYPATGITFGLDIIYEALKEKNFAQMEAKPNPCNVLIIPITTEAEQRCLQTATFLRNKKIGCEISLEKSLRSALDYANKEQIPWVIIVGIKELKENKYSLKNMSSGEEKYTSIENVIKSLKFVN